jgi:hypothetical protein
VLDEVFVRYGSIAKTTGENAIRTIISPVLFKRRSLDLLSTCQTACTHVKTTFQNIFASNG